ncbi:MAG: rhodanese-like domain-containing protein [Clostridia bacterium]|nr:rhodanese-like domain-containing protein [Clostridia bacterium]
MKKLCILWIAIFCIAITACTNHTGDTVNEQGESIMYEQITPQKAKELMETESDYIILDVREQDEFDGGHIPGAILIPYTQINAKAEAMLPDPDQLILVYCRSGRRSKIASESLVKLGYTNVKEFGGINDWPYGVE